MKNIRDVLTEVKGEKAHREAVAMGLKYKGFGYWVDPSSGQVTHKTENDQLVPVDPDVEAEKAGKGPEETAGMAAPGGGAMPGQSFGGMMQQMQPQLPVGSGQNVLGTAEDNNAKGPNPDNKRWDPGPDGDTFVGGQTKTDINDIEDDAFVKKNNNYKWTAGPDGDNFANITVQDMVKRMLNLDVFDEPGAVDPGPAANMIGSPMAEESMPEALAGGKEHQRLARGMLGLTKDQNPEPGGTTAMAANAIDQMGSNTQGQFIRKMADVNRNLETGEKTPALRALARKAPGILDRKGSAKSATEAIKHLVANPDFDLKDKGEELGSGLFGTVYKSKDGKHVIKDGRISRGELLALHAMRDNPAFPNLVNAELDEPFMTGKEEVEDRGYTFDPDEQVFQATSGGTHFFDETPMADGRFAMSLVNGRPLSDVFREVPEKQRSEIIQKIWRARAAMHMAGIAHNDMHGENIFVDDKGNPSILDFGLAQQDNLAALLEGLGGISGQDSQLYHGARGMGPGSSVSAPWVPEALKSRMNENWDNVQQAIMDSLDPDEDEDEEAMDLKMQLLASVMDGGIRQRPKDFEAVTKRFPILQDQEKVLDLVKMLYHNVADTEVGQRMSNAMDRAGEDNRALALQNVMSKLRGAKTGGALSKIIDGDD